MQRERGSESYRQRQRQQQRQHCADCDYRACQRGLNPARRELTSRRSNARARVAASIRRYLSVHIVIYYTGIYVFIFKKTNSYYIVLSQCSVLSINYPSLSHNPIQFQELTPGLRSRTRSRATATATRASSPERTLSLECDSSTDLCSDRSDSHWIFENNHQFITQTRHCVCVCSCVCLCLCVRHAALIYVHIEQAMYINFNSATHKKIERLEPSPAQPRSSSERQLRLRRRLRLRQRLRLCDSLDY